jgi:hypothetical protein
MELTTGAILRRITETPLSTSAHKLATIIPDGIAWKEGYNGLSRGTAAFTIAHHGEKMGVSRQYLTALLAELAESSLELIRWKPNGKFTPWLFRFGTAEDEALLPDVVSATGDTSLSRDSKNKTIFAGRIEIAAKTNVYHTPWADLIRDRSKLEFSANISWLGEELRMMKASKFTEAQKAFILKQVF